MVDAVFGIVPKIFALGNRFLEVDTRHHELDTVVSELASRVADMDMEVKNEERTHGKKRKRVFDAYSKQTEDYRASAQKVLDSSHEGQWMPKRMCWVPSLERHYIEGQELLRKGRQLVEEGLTSEQVKTRGEIIPVDEDQYTCKNFTENLTKALRVMKDGSVQCIGVCGYSGSGKTNLMKHLYNKVYEDKEGFKAVFWATAPEPDGQGNYNEALQKCVADAMEIDLENNVVHDEVRSAAMMTARVQEIGSGRIVLFLDNLKEEFPSYELLGIPSLETCDSTSTDNGCSGAKCILVFSSLSEDVCNRMRSDLTLKMDLLEEKEAQELFLHEVRRGDHNKQNNDGQVLCSNREKQIQQIAVKVANECARMPLAIIIIARSMVKIDNLNEWRNRLNELIGTVSSIHDDETKILQHLKFGYLMLKDKNTAQEKTVQQHCFLKAATLLRGDREVSKTEIIQHWKQCGLIGLDRPDEFVDDQGHAILNRLQRMCLLQVLPETQTVTMNKWICKMASSVSVSNDK